MNDLQTISPRWTKRQILIGQTLPFLVLTLLLNIALRFLFSGPLETLLVRPGHWLLARLFHVLILLAAIFLSLTALQLIANKKLASLSEAEAKVVLMEKSRFKWSYIFSLIFGYLLLYVLNILVDVLCITFHITSAPLLILLYILPIVAAVASAKSLNRVMVRKTRANQDAIEEFKCGYHDSEIPEKYRNPADIFALLTILENAQATTVRGAVLFYRIKSVVVSVGKKAAIVGGVLSIILAVLTMGFCSSLRSAAVSNADECLKGVGQDLKREHDINRLADEIAARLR